MHALNAGSLPAAGRAAINDEDDEWESAARPEHEFVPPTTRSATRGIDVRAHLQIQLDLAAHAWSSSIQRPLAFFSSRVEDRSQRRMGVRVVRFLPSRSLSLLTPSLQTESPLPLPPSLPPLSLPPLSLPPPSPSPASQAPASLPRPPRLPSAARTPRPSSQSLTSPSEAASPLQAPTIPPTPSPPRTSVVRAPFPARSHPSSKSFGSGWRRESRGLLVG